MPALTARQLRALKCADANAEYTKLVFTWGGAEIAAVPVARRPGGLLLALPGGVLPDSVFTEALGGGYSGVVGPSVEVSVPLAPDDAEAEDGVDVDAPTPAEEGVLVTLLDLASKGASALRVFDPDDPPALLEPFDTGPAEGLRWPSGGALWAAAFQWLAQQDVSEGRAGGYVTAVSGPGGVAEVASTAGSDAGGESAGADGRGRGRGARGKAKAKAAAKAAGKEGFDELKALTLALVGRVQALETPGVAAPQAAPAGAQPAAAVPGPGGPQLFAEASALGLSATEQARLLALLGPPPKRLTEPTTPAKAAAHDGAPSKAASGALAAATGPAGAAAAVASTAAEREAEEAAGELHQAFRTSQGDLSRALLLLERATRPSSSSQDPLAQLAPDESEDRRISGARGVAARQLLVEAMDRNPGRTVSSIKARLAAALGKAPASLRGSHMESYFRRQVPLDHLKTLTYFSFLLARVWELLEESRAQLGERAPEALDPAQAVVGLGCVFAEQVAMEGGGQFRLAWLLTGLREPPWAETEGHKTRPGDWAHARLADPRSVATNLAYLQDMKVLLEKTREHQRGGGAQGSGKKKEAGDE